MTTTTDPRDGLVGEVIDLRVQVYGDPTETFVRIAQVWSGILGHDVNPTDVPLCLIGMKAVRTTQAPDYSDNSDDIEGYLDIFRQLVGEDMIHARSVTEYIEQKQPRSPVDQFQRWRCLKCLAAFDTDLALQVHTEACYGPEASAEFDRMQRRDSHV